MSIASRRRTYSANRGLSLIAKLREWHDLAPIRIGPGTDRSPLRQVVRELELYSNIMVANGGKPLPEAKALEVGFGARPLKMWALHSMGVDAWGVDMDVPVLRGSLAEVWRAWRRNGAERALKSWIRSWLYDPFERARLASALAERGYTKLRIDPTRLVIGDVGATDVQERLGVGQYDLVFSEDVFEHVPKETLQAFLPILRRMLAPDGVILLRVEVYTGISGGHIVEWYAPVTTERRRRTEPWEHLRRRRVEANTYLNKLWLKDYRALFSEWFEIVEERVLDPDQGRAFYTPEVARELAHIPEEELFSNKVLFTLRPREPART